MSSKDAKNVKSISTHHHQTGKKSKSSEGKSSILQAFKGNSKENSPSSTIKQHEIRHHNPPPPSGPPEVMSGGALDDEPHPQLLAKLGLLYAEQRVSHVKTISHPHPLLNKGGAIHGTVSRAPSSQQQHHHHDNNKITSNSGGRKKPGYTGTTTITTSPASTLSDKGIGSSVGSFDVEFRNNQSHQQSHYMQHQGPQISRHHPLVSSNYETVNVPKTGSLDSRTQEYTHAMHHQEMGGFPVGVNHTRSSSDIICNRSAAVSSHLQRPNLAEQAQVPLWNHDPRRGTTTANQQPDMTSLMRTRRPGSRRPQFAVGGKMDGMETIDRAGGGCGAEGFCGGADVKKLPQLCVDSSSPGTLSGSSLIPNSSTSSIPAQQQQQQHEAATTAHNSGNNYHHQHQQQQYYPTPDSQLMPPPPAAAQHHQQHQQHHHLAHQQQQPPAGKMLAAHGRVSSDSSLGTLNGIQPGYHNGGGGGGEADGYYSKPWNHQGAAPPPYDRHQQQNNQHLLSNPAISVSGTGSSTSSDATYSAAPPPNMMQMSGTALWEQNARPHSMSVPFAPSLMTSHPDAYHIPEARSASPSINGDETLSRRGGLGRSSTRSNPGERRMMNPDTGVQRYGHHQQRAIDPVMQSLTFEIPLAVTSEVKFIGREWLYGEISQCFTRSESTTSNCKGVVVIGKAGHGKTSFVRHLVSYSYHGNRNPMPNGNNFRLDYDHLRPGANNTLQGHHNHHAILPRMNRQPPASLPPHMLPPSRSGSAQSSRTGSPIMNGSSASSRTGSQASLGEDSNCRKLASQVVAYHFCQSSVNKTCYVPEFISNIATQLTRAPQLTAYRELLLSDARLFQYVTIRNCIINPAQALHKGIIEPLMYLRKEQKLPKSTFIIIIDAIDEALLHKPDCGYSIFSFIEENIHALPDFMKIIVTARTREEDRVRRLPLETFTLDLSSAAVDGLGPRVTTPTTPTSPPVIPAAQKKPQQMTPEDEMIKLDLFAYVQYRINNTPDVLNMTRTVKGDGAEKKLISHLTRMSEGNFLYLRMTLDLMEKGHIIPKSINFKVVPQSLDEVFMLTCNQRFLSSNAYDEVRDIIAVALASLYPLTDERIFEAVSAGMPPGEQLDWVRFKDNLERQLNQFLVQTAPQSGRTFFHACLREWLMGQSDTQMNSAQVQRGGTLLLPSSHKYIVDFRRGHALLAAVVSNLPPERMDRKSTLELAHHVLKADMFRTRARKTGVSGSEHNALFMKKASTQMTEAFISARNLFYPSIKVNKLLLRAGANVNHPTTIFSKATPLAVVSHTGNVELSKLFLMFTANVDTPSTNGLSPLCYAAIAGRQDVVELLLQYGPNLNQADMNGHTALLHAISRGHTNIAHILLHCNLYKEPQERSIATQRALVAAAMTGCIQLINYVLTSEVLYCDVNACDPVNGEAALTAAAFCGKTDACDVLATKHRAQLNVRNRAGLTPLLKAVVHGEWATAELLLTLGAGLEEADPQGLTPMITAARQGHLGLLEVLLTRGAKIAAADKEGLTALSWSALQGKAPCVKSLIAHGADVDRCDVHGRAPLGLAAFRGDLEIVDMLLRAGADIAHHDVSGMSALDRAIGCEHSNVVAALLNHGSNIRETSWAMANNKNEMMTQLLGKSLEDANAAYKSGDFRSACDQYARALGHVNEPAAAATVANGHRLTGKLADICAHLLLGYSRCQRKDGDLACSEVSSTRALQLKPQWHEALYARARVLREKGNYKAALEDVNEAEKRAPKHNLKEIHRLGERIREEMRKNGATVNVPHHQPSKSEPVALPARPRTNSSLAAFRRQDSNLSQSYQLNPLSSGDFPGQLQRQRSHESLNESMLSLNGGTGYPEAPPRGGNHVRHPAVDRLVDHMERFTAGGPVVPPRPTEPNRYMPARAVNRGASQRPTTKSQFVTDL